MFKHVGTRRTFSHNLRLASLLSAVAGMVNICGLLSFNTLTTNVTGHITLLSEEIYLEDYSLAFIFFIYVFCFLLGAFTSGLLMEHFSQRGPRYTYITPITMELCLLILVALSPLTELINYSISSLILSCILLFSMGLQNALVTKISRSVVRTTHLTGLFTDLGLDLSRLIFRTDKILLRSTRKDAKLKIIIILSFFGGGVLAAFAYPSLGVKTLFLPAVLLAFTLWYDNILFRYTRILRKLQGR